MTKEELVYSLIQSKAGSDQFMKGLSAIAGFPFTLLTDAGTVFSLYTPMLEQIRAVYGRSSPPPGVARSLLEVDQCECLSDLAANIIFRQIPLIGMPVGVVYAKVMTWRLGILFAMLAAKGDDFTTENAKNALHVIHALFLRKGEAVFLTPSEDAVKKLLKEVQDCGTQDFDAKCVKILGAVS